MKEHNVRRVNVPWFNDGMTEAEVEHLLNRAMDATVEMNNKVTRKTRKNQDKESCAKQGDENKENIPPGKKARQGLNRKNNP